MAIASRSEHEMDWLAGVRGAFAMAREASPSEVHESYLRLCGRPVRLRAVGRELAEQLTRCFKTLQDPTIAGAPAAVDLSIHAWDRAATGVGCPGIPHAPDTTDVLGSGLVSQFRQGGLLRYDRASMVKCFDRASNELFVCVEDARRTDLADRCKPFPHFLATWCHDRGVEVLHAGLVSRRGRGVLLGGGSGSGKSTCAVVSALAGFDFLGDDCVGTEVTPTACRGHACYNAVRVDDGNLQRLPALQRHGYPPTSPRDKKKSLVYMSDVIPGRTVASTTIVAIAVPRIVGSGPSRLVPASKGATLRKLAPSTLLRGLGSRAEGLAHIAELVRRLPCYELELGAVLDDVPGCLDALLASVAP
jgi:hypothetical protein